MNKTLFKRIQFHLILSFNIAILVPAVIMTTVGIKLINNQVINRAETKTISGPNSAREIFRNKISHVESITCLIAVRIMIVNTLIERNVNILKKDLSGKAKTVIASFQNRLHKLNWQGLQKRRFHSKVFLLQKAVLSIFYFGESVSDINYLHNNLFRNATSCTLPRKK